MRVVTLPLTPGDPRRTAGHTHEDYVRPTTRAECRGGVRPCPWVSCKSHLGLDVLPERGGMLLLRPEVFEADEDGDAVEESCAEDVAEQAGADGLSYEEIGELMGLSRQSVYQFEQRALAKLKETHGRKDDEDEGGRTGQGEGASAAQPRAAEDRARTEVA